MEMKLQREKVNYIHSEKNTTTYLSLLLIFILAISTFSVLSYAAEKNVTFTIKIFTPKEIGIVVQPAVKTVLPGTRVSYTAKLENQNPVSVKLVTDVSAPSDWIVEVPNQTTISARSTRSITLKITSLNDTSVGSYSIGLRVVSEDGSISGSAVVAYNVDYHATADASITPASQTGIPGQTLTYNVHVINKDQTGFEPSTFSVKTILPKGWTGQLKRESSSGNSLSFKLQPGEEADVEYEVRSNDTAHTSNIGVNVTSNKLSTEAYAAYDVTLCGDGVCNMYESGTCALDCGPETKIYCPSGRCETQADDGVKFSAAAYFNLVKFIVCKRGATLDQCKSAFSSGCGLNKNCLCGKEGLSASSAASCNVPCVDTDGAYYMYGESSETSARSNYNYSFECPYVNLNGIKELKNNFSSSLTSFKRAKSALTEAITLNPLERFEMQPCLDAHSIIVNDLTKYVSFLNGVIKYPAVSNTTQARTRASFIARNIENNLTEFCSTGVTGLLKITSINPPSSAEIRSTATGSVAVNNPGSVGYYGFTQCEFSGGSKRIVVNSTCIRFAPGSTVVINPSVFVNATGSWSLECSAFGSLSSDCSAPSKHGSSSKTTFDVFTNDIYVKDVSGACSPAGINCTVRLSRNEDCSQCSINNQLCTKSGQIDDKAFFSCPYTPGNFTLTGKAFTSSECTPVTPDSKSITTRCAICGDNIVDPGRGEQCEMPNTDNNHFVFQQSGLLCDGKKSAIRDEFGYCNAQCKAVMDNVTFACEPGLCGAECKTGEVRVATIEKPTGACQCVQTCSANSCVFDPCDCTP